MFTAYLNDLNKNSLQDFLNILTSTGNSSDNYSKISYLNLKKKSPNDKLYTNVENVVRELRILDIIPHFCIVQAVVGGINVNIKIKDINLFDLIKYSTVENGLIKGEYIILFYRTGEIYISPSNLKSPMYQKALEIKESINYSSSEIHEKENFIYRNKKGLLSIHLGKLEVSEFNKNILGSIETVEYFIQLTTTKTKPEDISKFDIRNNNLKLTKKSPYIKELGENKIDFEIARFKHLKENNQSRKARQLGLWDQNETLLNDNIIHYIKSLDCSDSNISNVSKYLHEFYIKNKGEKFSSFKTKKEKGQASIIQLLRMIQFLESNDTIFSKDLDLQEIERILNGKTSFNRGEYVTLHKDSYEFNVESQSENVVNGDRYYGNYKILKNKIILNSRYYNSIEFSQFLVDLIAMRSKNII